MPNDAATRDGGQIPSSPSEGRVFTVDPNLLAPSDARDGDAQVDNKAGGNPEPSHSERNDQMQANTNGVQQLSVGEDTGAAGEPMSMGVGAAGKKKRSKKKPKSQRGLNAPTGFEEFYVDTPLTPAEYEEEKDLYDPELPFSQRIEVAIQRYCARRNMDSVRKDVFDKYLSLGGISSGSKQFSGGLDATAMSDMSAADIALMKATHFVDIDKHGGEDVYEVDFESCAKAFFSSRVPLYYDLSSVNSVKDVQAKTNVVRNFLSYLLHHDVAPEYKSQIVAARGICDLTDKELPKTMKAQSYFPGDFQTACSEIFGGIYQGKYAKNPDWAPEAESYAGISPEVAHRTFKIGLAAQASDEVTKRYKEQNASHDLETLKVYTVCLEVTELLPSDDGVKRFYEKLPAAKGLSPLGRLKAKSWDSPFKLCKDLTAEERLAKPKPSPIHNFEFLVEDYVLDTCFIGMKFETTVHDLSFGLKFFDNISGVFCSFYQMIPNERLLGWRVPEDEPLPPREKNIITPALEEVFGVEGGGTAESAVPHGEDADGDDVEETW
ncbi:MAG: hypothetical protein Q9221_000807 [Calogaya cf. arnoldii]